MNLVIINGPCGVGKSTVATTLHQTMPLSFLVEIDAIRRLINGYNEHAEETSQYSFSVALAIIETHLQTGNDVIVEKMMRDETRIDRMIALAKHHGARVTEIILWARKDFVLKRATDRGYREDSLLTPEKCERFWNEIDVIKNKRPGVIVIDVEKLSPDVIVERIKVAMQIKM
ncbi:MAG TPA: AAA family ATPase [Patescibacteria group bacterium]|nr:AAA family ATPase [Patescibacteria group bacterium]